MSALETLGWDPTWQKSLDEVGLSGTKAARVVGEGQDILRIQFSTTEGAFAQIGGKLRHEAVNRLDFPAVGDWVAVEWTKGDDRALVRKILPRRSCLIRKTAGRTEEAQILAANVDTTFIATSLNSDLNPRRLERYLALVWESGSTPVILLTKSDLVEETESKIESIEAIAAGVAVHPISVRAGLGIDALMPYFGVGKTSVLIGSSGVGKSTLVNNLLGFEVMKTREIREDDGRGRHTTSSRNLFLLPTGGLLIDTPGMRELHLWEGEEGLATAFPEIEQLATECKFRDCAHGKEPGCKIRASLESGALDKARFQSYQKLLAEQSFEVRKGDKVAQSEQRKKWRTTHKAANNHIKNKKK